MQPVCVATAYGTVAPASHSWREIVEGTIRGQAPAEYALYEFVSRASGPFFVRQVGTERAEDLVAELFMIVLKSIRAGRVRDAECLAGYVMAIARHMVRRAIQRISLARRRERPADVVPLSDRSSDPERARQRNEILELMRTVLSEMTVRASEILQRFYLDEEPAEQICSEMGLSSTQFRLLKWRAKAHFAVLAKKRLRVRGLLAAARRDG